MLLFIAWFVWIAIWGVIGWATFMSIRERIKQKRAVDDMVKYWAEKRKLEQLAQTGMYRVMDINSIGEEIKFKG